MNNICLPIIFSSVLITALAGAQEIKSIPEVGVHVKLFTFEKSENPQNIMIGYTKLDADCRFVRDGGQPLLDYYWLMDGTRYKPVHSMIKREVRGRLAVEASPTATGIGTVTAKDVVDRFALKVQNFKGLSSELGKVDVVVKSVRDGKDCRAFVEVREEKSGFSPLKLQVIKAVSEGSMFPPFRKFVSLTFSGTDLKTGAEEKQTIH